MQSLLTRATKRMNTSSGLLTCLGADGAHGINFIDEDDARRFLRASPLEQVSYSSSTDSHDRFNEVATGHLIEGDARLSGNCLRAERLAAAGWTLEQHPLWRPSTQG